MFISKFNRSDKVYICQRMIHLSQNGILLAEILNEVGGSQIGPCHARCASEVHNG